MALVVWRGSADRRTDLYFQVEQDLDEHDEHADEEDEPPLPETRAAKVDMTRATRSPAHDGQLRPSPVEPMRQRVSNFWAQSLQRNS